MPRAEFRLPDTTINQLDAIARRLPRRGRDMPATRTDAVIYLADKETTMSDYMTTVYPAYAKGYQAHTTDGETVTLPDAVHEDQRGHDGDTVDVLERRGSLIKAVLRGDRSKPGLAANTYPAATLEPSRRDWLTPSQAAALLAVSPKTVRRWARQNWLTYRTVSPSPSRIQVSRIQVEELVGSGVTPSFDDAS